MNVRHIKIKLNHKEDVFLVGYEEGVHVCQEQILPVQPERLIIEVPDNVIGVAIGYIKGILDTLSSELGYGEAVNFVSFKSTNKDLEKKMNIDIIYGAYY